MGSSAPQEGAAPRVRRQKGGLLTAAVMGKSGSGPLNVRAGAVFRYSVGTVVPQESGFKPGVRSDPQGKRSTGGFMVAVGLVLVG